MPAEKEQETYLPDDTRKLLDLETPLRDALAAALLLEYVQLDDLGAANKDMVFAFLTRQARGNLESAVSILDRQRLSADTLPRTNLAG